MNKWSDPIYHSLECIRELSAAEIHLVQYIELKDQNNELKEILKNIRELRKKIEGDTLGE